MPGHIQLQGYDKPHYVNTQYSWDGHEDLRPPSIPKKYNPTAAYIKYFEVPTTVPGDKHQEDSGPGHNSIFRSHDQSKIYMAYHVHMYPLIGGGEREVLISEVEFSDGEKRLIK